MHTEKRVKSSNKTPQKNNLLNTQVTSDRNYWLWLAAIVALTYIAFTPALKNGFTNWDDNVYIDENILITSLSSENIKQIFSTHNPVALNYHPITILSFAINHAFSGYNPSAYHFTNLLFHLFNTALVFTFIFLLSVRKIHVAAITALLFGIHPMHVESVVWISERKDVLYVFFFLTSLIVYYKYLSANGGRKFLLYGLVLLLFLFSVVSKAMAVVLPLILLLIDYYSERKFDKYSILEKTPFFLISIIYGMLAFRIQREGAAVADVQFTFLQRTEFAFYGLINYIYHLFIPVNLSCFYPYPKIENGSLPIIFHLSPFIVLAMVISLLWFFRKNKNWVFGFLFFLITIALVLQFVSVGKVIMADRYSYLSYVGLFFIIAMSVDGLQNKVDDKFSFFKKNSFAIVLVCALLLSIATYKRCQVWRNSDTLWTDAIAKYPNSEAYWSRGSYLSNKQAIDIEDKNVEQNEYDRALSDFSNSIKLNNSNANVYAGRANIYSIKGQFDLALTDYEKAIALDNKNAQTYFNRAGAYNLMKQYDKAIADYSTALTLKPDYITAKQNRVKLYINTENYSGTIKDLNDLIKTYPNNPEYYFYRGFAFSKTNKLAEAIADDTKCLQLSPNNATVYYNRSYVYKKMGNIQLSLDDILKAKGLGYNVDEGYIKELQVSLGK